MGYKEIMLERSIYLDLDMFLNFMTTAVTTFFCLLFAMLENMNDLYWYLIGTVKWTGQLNCGETFIFVCAT